MYSPTQGRFLTRDPSGEGGGMNLHAYADDDPVNLNDPSGLAPKPRTYGEYFEQIYHKALRNAASEKANELGAHSIEELHKLYNRDPSDPYVAVFRTRVMAWQKWLNDNPEDLDDGPHFHHRSDPGLDAFTIAFPGTASLHTSVPPQYVDQHHGILKVIDAGLGSATVPLAAGIATEGAAAGGAAIALDGLVGDASYLALSAVPAVQNGLFYTLAASAATATVFEIGAYSEKSGWITGDSFTRGRDQAVGILESSALLYGMSLDLPTLPQGVDQNSSSLVTYPGGTRVAAIKAHNVLDNHRAIRQSAVAVAEAEVPSLGTQYYASGSGAYLTPAQRESLIASGVPRENIFSGAAYRLRLDSPENTRIANHAEKVILRNVPQGTIFKRWGISWTFDQRPNPCNNCAPGVEASKGNVEGR